MADKIINTRIMLKIDTLANWQNESAGEGKGANYILKKGEIGFAQVPASDSAVKTANDTPTVLFKVGDGTTPFKNLKWGAAVAADVYAWAKKSSLDFNDLSNDFKTALQNYIEEYSDLDTNTIYQVVPGTGDNAGKLFFQSADGTAATPSWQTAYTIDLTSFGINVTAQEINNISSASSITQQDINNWNNEIGAKDLAEDNAEDITALQNQIAGLDMARVTAEEGYMIDYIEQTDGQVAAQRRAITAADIPALDASKITSGTFADARIASAATWNAKQDALSAAQLAAVDSGITAAKVTSYDTHVADTDIHVTAADKTTWSGKQDALSEAQLAAANSGITAAKVSDYDDHIADTDIHVTAAQKTEWSGKQDALEFLTAPSSSNKVVTEADIADITGAMHFRGVVTGADAETALATISDPEAGDVAIYGTSEYVYGGSPAAWHLFGDEGVYETQAHASQTYVPKTTEINGHALSGDVDLDASDVGVSATANSVTVGNTTISNIVSDANYVHTDNNYTTTEKTKLAGIEEGAQVNFIKSVDTTDFSVDANGRLDLATGMNLVTNEQITKITNISEDATKVEASQQNGYIKIDGTETLVYDDTALAGRVSDVEDAIDILNDDASTSGSVDNKIATALSDIQDQIDDLEDALDDKVDKNGTDRLMTADEGTKLAAIEAGAQVNVLEGVQMNGTDLPITNKKVNILTNTAYDASTNKVATMSDISTDNLLQGVNEFVLNCGTSDVVQG